MAQRPLNHILNANTKTLKADLTQFAQLDQSLSNIPVHIGKDDLAVSFEHGETSKNSFSFNGTVTLPNHHKEKLELIKAKASGDSVEIEFVQDVDLNGAAKTYTYTPSPEEKKEYNSFRNGLFNTLHSLIVHEYSGKNSAKLIRKKFKPSLA